VCCGRIEGIVGLLQQHKNEITIDGPGFFGTQFESNPIIQSPEPMELSPWIPPEVQEEEPYSRIPLSGYYYVLQDGSLKL